jgi:hypothetical protein
MYEGASGCQALSLERTRVMEGSSVRHGGRELHSAKIHEIPGAPGVEGGGYASTT